VAESFQDAAPNSVLENLYGPTELTIACTLYRYDRGQSQQEAELGVVPIGEPYPGMTALVADDDLREVPVGDAGELLMTGPQLSAGYWEDPEKTEAAFVVPPGLMQTFYRTGDRVKRRSPGQPLLYLGRVDNQIKVQGYRVELGEIEAAVRDLAHTDTAVAIGHPMGPAGAEGILVFMGPATVEPGSVKAALQAKLPRYMHPSDVIPVAGFPLNANGKVDRAALLAGHLGDTGAVLEVTR
jgi:acyl-coenzyme A synthetase/AMP-(fatty) acid ligase